MMVRLIFPPQSKFIHRCMVWVLDVAVKHVALVIACKTELEFLKFIDAVSNDKAKSIFVMTIAYLFSQHILSRVVLTLALPAVQHSKWSY